MYAIQVKHSEFILIQVDLVNQRQTDTRFVFTDPLYLSKHIHPDTDKYTFTFFSTSAVTFENTASAELFIKELGTKTEYIIVKL